MNAETSNIAAKYAIPPEFQVFLDNGFLEVLSETEAEKTVKFHIHAMRFKDGKGRITAFSVVWIHPDHNAQFCHYYNQTPGDLANFYVSEQNSELGDEILDIKSVDDLLAWLEEKQAEAD